jgi:hypothetical protein
MTASEEELPQRTVAFEEIVAVREYQVHMEQQGRALYPRSKQYRMQAARQREIEQKTMQAEIQKAAQKRAEKQAAAAEEADRPARTDAAVRSYIEKVRAKKASGKTSSENSDGVLVTAQQAKRQEEIIMGMAAVADTFLRRLASQGVRPDENPLLAYMRREAQQAAHRIAAMAPQPVSRGLRLAPTRKAKPLKFAQWNMSRLSKSQIQIVVGMEIDAVGFTEVWSSADSLQDYMGTNRMLVAGSPPKHDPAGSTAMLLSAKMARALQTSDDDG